jgi:hypothetical protein
MSNLISAKFQKRISPTALDYMINWSPWLGTDTINTSTWTVPTGITKVTSTNTTTTATIWLSGGTEGKMYEVVNTIITSGGRTDYRTLLIEVID